MNKRERLERTIAGEVADRCPVAAWRHFPGDDQRSVDHAHAALEFQRAFDWDYLTVMPSSSFMVADYSFQDEWEGAIDGTRHVQKRPISRSLDWTTLRVLEPSRGSMSRQTETLRLVCDALGDSVPIVQPIYSPLMQAEMLAGSEMLIRHLRTEPERLRSALNVLSENILRFLETIRRFPIAGVVYITRHASYAVMSEEEYTTFGIPFDSRIWTSLQAKWWLNLLMFECEMPMFKFAAGMPFHGVIWQDQTTEPSLAQGKTLVQGCISGGVARKVHLHYGSPAAIREHARDSIRKVANRRLILSPGATALITTPLSNFRALRESVEMV
jgi:uroporphyrinogen decarboxylase